VFTPPQRFGKVFLDPPHGFLRGSFFVSSPLLSTPTVFRTRLIQDGAISPFLDFPGITFTCPIPYGINCPNFWKSLHYISRLFCRSIEKLTFYTHDTPRSGCPVCSFFTNVYQHFFQPLLFQLRLCSWTWIFLGDTLCDPLHRLVSLFLRPSRGWYISFSLSVLWHVR